MIDELTKLRELTETLTGNGYLKDQTEEWEYALDAIPDCVYIINKRFKIKFVNKALATKLGRAKTDLYDKTCYKAIVGNEKDVPPEAWKEYDGIKAHSVLEDVYLENLAGWFNITRSPIYTEANKLLGFICVLQDITEKKKVERELKESRGYFERLISKAPMGVFVYELSGNDLIMTHFNEAAEKILAVSAEGFIGKTIENAFPGLKDKPIIDHYKKTASAGTVYKVEDYPYGYDDIKGLFLVHAFQSAANEVVVFFTKTDG